MGAEEPPSPPGARSPGTAPTPAPLAPNPAPLDLEPVRGTTTDPAPEGLEGPDAPEVGDDDRSAPQGGWTALPGTVLESVEEPSEPPCTSGGRGTGTSIRCHHDAKSPAASAGRWIKD